LHLGLSLSISLKITFAIAKKTLFRYLILKMQLTCFCQKEVAELVWIGHMSRKFNEFPLTKRYSWFDLVSKFSCNVAQTKIKKLNVSYQQ
jgi:hypothetical protein